MTNDEIIIELKKNGFKGIRLPISIDFSLENQTLKLFMKNVLQNMQEDKSAFEGWILCLKALNQDKLKISKVELEWKIPSLEDKEKNKGHYNRFLFRVIQFSKMFEWFSCSVKNIEEVQIFNQSFNNLIINYPTTFKRSSKADAISDKREDKIEILFTKKPSILTEKLGLETVNQQLPVGIFHSGKKSKITRLFTGNKSAIDLWGIKGKELSIFELKYANPKVGIISELLFYLCVMRNVFMNVEDIEIIKYPLEAEKVKHREFDKLYILHKERSVNKLTGYLLIDKLHPFINLATIALINEGLKRLGDITVAELYYQYENDSETISWK